MKKRRLLLIIPIILIVILLFCFFAFRPEPPEENEELHVFLQAKDGGDCKKLTGDVLFAVFFAGNNQASWAEEAKKSAERFYQNEADCLIKEAQKYGAELKISFVYFDCTADAQLDLFNNTEWISQALTSAGISEGENAVEFLKEYYKKDEVAVIFAVNDSGRSYALPKNGGAGFECAFIYNNASFRHEILHVFGARDFYYPQSIKSLAEKYFNKSVMLNSANQTVDDLTAYLIGWSAKPSDIAQAFIDETADISQEEINEATEKETITGKGQYSSHIGTYEGDLADGIPHGDGTYYFNSGDIYTGHFDKGEMDGRGTYMWSDGSIYIGEFASGKPFGQGSHTMINGDIYTGNFVDGKLTGQGTLVMADGTVYTGDFISNERTGRGMITYPDGSTYTGEFLKGKYDGNGTLTLPDGTTQSGTWERGRYCEFIKPFQLP